MERHAHSGPADSRQVRQPLLNDQATAVRDTGAFIIGRSREELSMERKRYVAGLLLLMVLSFTVWACSYSGDTSGFKPQKGLTKAQIEQQITITQSDTRIPASIRAMSLSHLNDALKKDGG